MTDFVRYITDIATTIYSYLLERIGEDIPLYFAYAFCLLCVLAMIIVCCVLLIKFFQYLWSLGKKVL